MKVCVLCCEKEGLLCNKKGARGAAPEARHADRSDKCKKKDNYQLINFKNMEVNLS